MSASKRSALRGHKRGFARIGMPKIDYSKKYSETTSSFRCKDPLRWKLHDIYSKSLQIYKRLFCRHFCVCHIECDMEEGFYKCQTEIDYNYLNAMGLRIFINNLFFFSSLSLYQKHSINKLLYPTKHWKEDAIWDFTAMK